MKKSTVIVLSVCGSVVLVTCVVLSLVFGLKKSGGGSGPGPSPLSPKDQCSSNGYIWDPVNQVCTTNQCIATVDPQTGKLSGTMVDVTGTACLDVNSGAYLSPFARASLLKLCQAAKFVSLEISPAEGAQCTQATGCATKPFTANSIMDGCPYMTYQPSSTSGDCVPPTLSQLEYLCNTSVNGCPLGSSLNANCSENQPSQPCYDPNQGCIPQLAAPGCRPLNESWQWSGAQCLNTTVSNTIAVTVTTANVSKISGTFVLDNPPQSGKLLWQYVLTDTTTKPKSWQGPVTIQSDNFTVALSNLPLTVNATYNLVLQVYVSADENAPYVLRFTSVVPSKVTLGAGPVVPGLVTLKPALSIDLAQQVAKNVPGAISQANSNSQNNPPFFTPSTDVWNNSLQGISDQQNFLIVPCTSAYCKNVISDGIVMLILAWPTITTLSADQIAEITKACPSLTAPQVSYAVYQDGTMVGNKLTGGTWVQPLSSDPTVTTQFQVVAYVWSGSDEGVLKSTCLSQPLTVTVQVPTNLYSTQVCYNIQPLVPQGKPIPGNFMLYHPGANMCLQPGDTLEALEARDFSCLTSQSEPTLQTLQLYGCNDIGSGTPDNCNTSGQGCMTITPYSTVRQPVEGESLQCKAPSPNTTPPCSGLQYCQQAACNCPESVDWSLCGTSTFAQVGPDKAIEAGHWENRVNNLKTFIQSYGLDKVVNVQTFMNETNDPSNVQKTWDKLYGLGVCPLPNWSAPEPGSCDVTTSHASQQSSVCEPWLVDSATGPAMYKQQIVTYPTTQQQSDCCAIGSTYVNGCCCPNADSGSSCTDYQNCVPAASATLGPTWCKPK